MAMSIPMAFKTEDHAIRRQLLPHVVVLRKRATVDDADAFINADEMDRASHVLRENGQWAEAASLQLRALKLKEKLLGREHEATLYSMSYLALLLRDQGQAVEAAALHRKEFKVKR
jgi:hypothetical protein